MMSFDVGYAEQAVVADGRVATSRQLGTATDFSLQLIELLIVRCRREPVEQTLQRT